MAVTEESNLAKKVSEKASETKFSDEELTSLKSLQEGYTEKQAQFGQLKVQKLLVQEQDLVKQLNEKYGPGSLDPATGVFTPAPPNTEVTEASETT